MNLALVSEVTSRIPHALFTGILVGLAVLGWNLIKRENGGDKKDSDG